MKPRMYKAYLLSHILEQVSHWPDEHRHALSHYAKMVGKGKPFWLVQVEYEKNGDVVFLLHMDDRPKSRAQAVRQAHSSVEDKGGTVLDIVPLLVIVT